MIAGHIKTCRRNITGNLHLFIADIGNVHSITVTAGEVSDIEVNAGTYFWEIQADQDTIIKTTEVVNDKAGIYQHQVIFKISGANQSINELIDNINASSPCGLAVIVMDSNGKAHLVGFNETDQKDRPMKLSNHSFDSEEQTNEFTLTGINQELSLPTNTTINDYIKACLAAGSDIGFTP